VCSARVRNTAKAQAFSRRARAVAHAAFIRWRSKRECWLVCRRTPKQRRTGKSHAWCANEAAVTQQHRSQRARARVASLTRARSTQRVHVRTSWLSDEGALRARAHKLAARRGGAAP
jgi:hypothetical protein